MRTTVLLFPAAAALLFGTAVMSAPVPYYKNTAGRVGYHMVVQLKIHRETLPQGCSPGVDGVQLDGTLPPGMEMRFVPNSTDEGFIEGTPRQPGDWDAHVTMQNVTCGTQSFGDLSVPL